MVNLKTILPLKISKHYILHWFYNCIRTYTQYTIRYTVLSIDIILYDLLQWSIKTLL